MGFVCFKNLCMIIIFILLTTYYISAFRLIHTHAEIPETETKKDIKEHVKKAYMLKDEHKNQSIHVKLEDLKNEITPEKNVKTLQPTVTSQTLKDKIKEGLKSKEVDDDDIKPTIRIIQKDKQGKSKFVPIKEDIKEETLKLKREEIVKPKATETPKAIKEAPKPIKEAPKPIKEAPKPIKEAPKPKKEEAPKPDIQKESKGKSKEESSKIVKELFTKKEEPTKPKMKIIQKDTEGKSKFVSVNQKEEIQKPSKTSSIKEDIPKPKVKVTTKIEDKGISKEESSRIVKELFAKKDEPPKSKTKVIKKDTEGKSKFVSVSSKDEVTKSVKREATTPPKVKETIKQPASKPVVKEAPQKEAPRSQKEASKSEIEASNGQKKTSNLKESKPKPESPKPQVVKSKPTDPPKNTTHTHDPILNLVYYNLPSFAPNFEILENEECKKQGHLLLEQLNQRKIWALKMFDSTAKVPSGILKGNLNQFGDYDQCVGIFTKIMNEDNVSDTKISGKYCLANIDIEADVKDMKLPVHLAQSRAMIRSKLQDPGHFIPRFTTIRWGICIPSGCTAEDAEKILENSIKFYNESDVIGLTFDVSVESDQCYVRKGMKNYWDYPVNTLITISITLAIILTVLIATIRDLHFTDAKDTLRVEIQNESILEKIFMTFSLKRTTRTLFKNQTDPDDIQCIHGVRSICSILLYIAHRLIPIGQVPFFNKINLTEIANNPASIILRLSVIYTDSFLLLSGILTSYGMTKDLEKKGYIPWLNRLVARYIRLTPPLMFIILYYAYIMEHLGDGPLWNTVVTPNAKLCKEYWWRNLLYIQNYYPFQEMCATHSHQLALDMQLSLIAPIIVWFLYRRPLMGITITIFLHTLSVILRYYTTVNYRLSLVIYHGISISQLYRTANYLYASSIHRATPYLAGVSLGVLLRQIKPNFYMPKILTISGWLVAGYFAGWALYSPSHLSSRMYQYDTNEAAQFSALCSLAWALALSWLIFACFADNEGYLNKILSSRPMILLSRISYTLYLTQFIVFFYYVGTIRSPTEFQVNTSISLIEMSIVLIFSILLALIIDIPAQKIKSILLQSIANHSTDKDHEESEIFKNNIQKSSKDEDGHEISVDKNKKILSVHFNEEIEEVNDDDEHTSKRLILQLSTESQMSTEEDLDEDLEDDRNDRLITQLSTESQISLEEEHFNGGEYKEDNRLVSQLSTESQMSEEEQEDTSQISMEEEHFDDKEDSSDKTLSRELSTEKQIEEEHFEKRGNTSSTEKLWFEDEPEELDMPEDEIIQKITVQLSSNGKISVQEQIQQALDDEDDV